MDINIQWSGPSGKLLLWENSIKNPFRTSCDKEWKTVKYFEKKKEKTIFLKNK